VLFESFSMGSKQKDELMLSIKKHNKENTRNLFSKFAYISVNNPK